MGLGAQGLADESVMDVSQPESACSSRDLVAVWALIQVDVFPLLRKALQQMRCRNRFSD